MFMSVPPWPCVAGVLGWAPVKSKRGPMSDLIESGDNAPEFSVSELSGAIKRVIEGEFAHVRIRGELGRVSRPRSGHVYLDLKDDRSVISGVIWKGVAARLALQPEEGLEVIATGRVTTFAGQSKYQLVIEDLQPAGQGALMALLEKRKAALAAEGLFDDARKRPLPYLPEIIGVVTSPSGAVIRDILHRLRDRFPRKVLVWPVAVQGARCAPEVARAIAGFNALTPRGALPRPDLIIVARGGGSVEDLWGFNEEEVARAAAASEIPLISAVGHETDTTLIDYVSDQRAPTPTAAAELAVPVRHELMAWAEGQGARAAQALSQGLRRRAERLRDLARALPRADALLDGPRQRLDRAQEQLPAALTGVVQRRRLRLMEHGGALRPGALRLRIAEQGRHLEGRAGALPLMLERNLTQHRRDFAGWAARLDPERLGEKLARQRSDYDQLNARLGRAATAQLESWSRALAAQERLRQTLGYTATLERGYAVVRGADGAVLTRAADARKTAALEIEFADGRVRTGGAPARKAAPKQTPEQGSLF